MELTHDIKVDDNGFLKTTVEAKVEISDRVVKDVKYMLSNSHSYLKEFEIESGAWHDNNKLKFVLDSSEYEITIKKKK